MARRAGGAVDADRVCRAAPPPPSGVDRGETELKYELVGEEFEYPEYKEDWGNVIVVDNLPKIPMAKHDKLLGVLKRIFAQTGTIERLVMPQENEKTLGVAFVEFATAEEAVKAIRLTDGYALDKSHVFKVNAYLSLIHI